MGVGAMKTCTRRLEFDAGHRVLKHEGKCRHVHGHRYRVDITVSAPELDAVGRVVDFSVIKDVVGTWLDDEMDHGYPHHPDDEFAVTLKEMGMKTFEMSTAYPNPTAENLCLLIASFAKDRLRDLTVESVRVYETPNCWADWKRP